MWIRIVKIIAADAYFKFLQRQYLMHNDLMDAIEFLSEVSK